MCLLITDSQSQSVVVLPAPEINNMMIHGQGNPHKSTNWSIDNHAYGYVSFFETNPLKNVLFQIILQDFQKQTLQYYYNYP